MKNLKKITLRSLAILSVLALIFFFTGIPSTVISDPGNSAEVITKPDGTWSCSISLANGSEYTGNVHAVITPSGNVHATCNAKLVSGPGVSKLYRFPGFDLIVTPGGTALWKIN